MSHVTASERREFETSLPESIPCPKYRLFQQTNKGQITGMNYISAGIALFENSGGCGWIYVVRKVSGIGISIEELVEKAQGLATDEYRYYEDQLAPVEDN